MSERLERETAALVALLRGGRLPWSVYADMVEDAGSASAVLEAELDGPQGALFADADESARQLADARETLGRWTAQGYAVLTVLHEQYPENLRQVHDRPPLIFVAGELIPEDSRSIAVVGARKASAAGVARAERAARHLIAGGYTVFSGLAAGIDTAAHTTALSGGGRTVAVIGTGLNRCYPPENLALQRQIAEQGAVISQFWPDAPPTRRTFPMRNATMSGLTLATVVVEASRTSGSRMQARLALEHGRPVFLAEELLEQDWARAYAERSGTRVYSCPEQITAAVERLTSSDTLVA